MKKRKVAVALGLCLAVGLCGAGLAACGDDPAKKPAGGDKELVISTTDKSDYYLAGSSKSELFASTPLGEWNGNGHASNKAQIPDTIALWKTNKANTYAIKVDLYSGDAFQILVAGDENNGWGGQMGADVIKPTPTESDPFGDRPGGGANSDMYVRQDGNYTIVLKVDAKKGNTVTYTRNGNAAALPTQYNYWVMGENITNGKAMYNELTTFTTDNKKLVYTTTVNLKEDEKISILEAAVSAGNNGTNIVNATLGSNVTVLTAIPATQEDETPVEGEGEEGGEQGGEEGEDPTPAPEGPVYQYQATAAGSYTITITETDNVNPETNEVTTTRVITATKADTIEYEFKLRSSAYGDELMEENEFEFLLDNETGKYVLQFSVPDPRFGGQAPDTYEPGDPLVFAKDTTIEIDVVKAGGSAIGNNGKIEYTLDSGFVAPWAEMSYGIDYTSYTIKEAGEYTITIDPDSFEVKVTREDEGEHAYRVYAHGSYSGASGWADNKVSGLATWFDEEGETGETYVILDLKAGDEFGFRTYYAADYGKTGQLDWASAGKVTVTEGATAIIADVLKGAEADGVTGNFKVLADGKFMFTLTVDKDGKITAIAVEYEAPEETPAE